MAESKLYEVAWEVTRKTIEARKVFAKSEKEAIQYSKGHLHHAQAITELNVLDIEQIEEPTEIDVIASGYDWVCPMCDTDNNNAHIEVKFQCKSCNFEFTPGDVSHAT